MTRENISNALGGISHRHIQEAADFQPERRAPGRRFFRRRAAAAVAGIALLLVLSVPALAAAELDPAYELLYRLSPAVAQRLKPLRLSCQDEGIRFEVLSASVAGGEATAYVSVEDLQGDRLDETTDLFDSYRINSPFACTSSCRSLGYDPERKTAVFRISISQWDKRDITGDKITLQVGELLCQKRSFEAALPELALAGATEAECFVPPQIRGGSGAAFPAQEKPLCALVSRGTLFSPVEGVDVTALGYVEGKLHIQVRYENIPETDNHGYIYLQNSAGEALHCEASFSYFESETGSNSIQEYIFDLPESAPAEYTPYGHFVTGGALIRGAWSVTFPLESVNP